MLYIMYGMVWYGMFDGVGGIGVDFICMCMCMELIYIWLFINDI